MIKAPKNISLIKEEIKTFYDKDVCVHVNLGRNKTADFTGRLTGVYPALFTVLPDDKNYRGKTAYSYTEVLCGNVKISGAAHNPQVGKAAPLRAAAQGQDFR